MWIVNETFVETLAPERKFWLWVWAQNWNFSQTQIVNNWRFCLFASIANLEFLWCEKLEKNAHLSSLMKLKTSSLKVPECTRCEIFDSIDCQFEKFNVQKKYFFITFKIEHSEKKTLKSIMLWFSDWIHLICEQCRKREVINFFYENIKNQSYCNMLKGFCSIINNSFEAIAIHFVNIRIVFRMLISSPTRWFNIKIELIEK